jgi:hypothetical protein
MMTLATTERKAKNWNGKAESKLILHVGGHIDKQATASRCNVARHEAI